jgi:hypothetical protein
MILELCRAATKTSQADNEKLNDSEPAGGGSKQNEVGGKTNAKTQDE